MTSVKTASLRLERYVSLVEEARVRASRLGRPVLASYTCHVGPEPDFDPLWLVNEPDSFVWEQADRGLSLAGVGQTVRVTAGGESRFRDVRAQLQDLLECAVIGQDTGAALRPTPLSFAGFAFDPEHPDSVAWYGFPDALLVLPRLLIARSGAHLFVTANLLVEASDVSSGLVDSISKLAGRLFEPARAGATAITPAHLLDPGPDARVYWDESVQGLTAAIGRGEADKVVLARRVQVECQGGFDLAGALLRLRERYPECTVFAARAGDACFLGATPEMLVSLRGGDVRADCLAGSAARGRGVEEDRRLGEYLLGDDKERREHAFVARSVREALAPLAREIRAPEQPGLRQFANVQHLHTPVEATVDGRRHVLELVEALHPSAATAGLPRVDSLRLLCEHEAFSRGWYAGPVGWIDAEGGGEFAVALRSALVREDVASLYAGCGIVTGSDPEREYTESDLKLQPMLWALNADGSSNVAIPSPSGRGQE
jgi:menaquinone-specific isochorismate synthase